MAAAMISDRGLRKKLTQELAMPDKPPRKPAKRKPTPSSSKDKKSEQNNNQSKKPKVSTGDPKLDLFNTYQPWVIQTYGDQAKTKTITLKKYSRILKVLRGEECNTSDSSKFRFWVKAKGFNLGAPLDYEAKPADGIVCRYSVRDAEGCARNPDGTEVYTGSQNDPALYVPTPPLKSDPPDEPTVFRKVAIVENFFDIIYTVHVELEGRDGKHAGQKRTYRTITETYAFLPREAVTRFLAGCAECARRPRSASPHPASLPLLTPSPSPTYPQTFLHYPQEYTKNWESEIDAQKPSVYDFTEPQPHIPSPKNVQDDKPVYIELTSKPKINGIKDILKNTPPSTPVENTVRKDPEIDKDEENSLIDIEDLKSNSPLPVRQEEAKVESLNETLKNFAMPTAEEKIADKKIETKKPYNPLDVCNLTSKDPPKSGTPPKKRLYSKPDHINGEPRYPKCWAPDMCLYFSNGEEIDYSVPITTAYLKHMRSLGHQDLKDFDKKDNIGSDLNEANEDDVYSGQAFTKDAEKLKMMLLAWNYHSQSQGRNGDVSDSAGADMAELWASYHSALGLAKPPKVPTPSPQRDQTSPVQVSGSSAVEASAHDETSSSAGGTGKDDDDAMGGSDDDSDDRVDPQHHDPERLKAFNMFVRLFVDENLDRIIPISKQPKEKIQAIIDSCTRQFPEFAERARKRIRTYLKSCRRNKKVRGDVNPTGNGSSSGGTGNAWDSAVRPTPAHLTSVQAEHILAQACENESMNAKRMRLGLDPVSQPLPSGHANAMDTTAPSSVASSFLSLYSAAAGSPTLPTSGASSAPAVPAHSKPVPDSTRPSASPTLDSQLLNNNSLKLDNANGSAGSKTVSPASSPSPMFRPSFSNAFGSQHTFGRQSSSNTNTPAASALTNSALLSTLTAMPNAGVGMNAAAVAAYQSALLSAMAAQSHTFPNLAAPTDLSMKTVTTSTPLHAISSSVSGSLASTPAPKTPLLSHKLSGAEVGAVRQLITGYRESAAFLLRSADELEALLLQQP